MLVPNKARSGSIDHAAAFKKYSPTPHQVSVRHWRGMVQLRNIVGNYGKEQEFT